MLETAKLTYHFTMILELKQNLQWRPKYIRLNHSIKQRSTKYRHAENSDKSMGRRAYRLVGEYVLIIRNEPKLPSNLLFQLALGIQTIQPTSQHLRIVNSYRKINAVNMTLKRVPTKMRQN